MSGSIQGKGPGLQEFLTRAQESGKGDVRISTGGELINKGTLGHMLGTLLGRGDVESRDDRTKEAMKGFREALTQEYGKDYANEALLKAGITDQDGNFTDKFTGGQILKSVEIIKNSIETDFKESVENESKNYNMSEKQSSVFESRFREALNLLTEGGSKSVTKDQVDKLGLHMAMQIMTVGENLNMSEIDRGHLKESTDRLFHVDVFRDPKQMLTNLLEVDGDLKNLLNDEGDTDHDGGANKLSISLGKSIESRTNQDFDTMLELPGRSLSSNSSLRGIYCAAKEMTQDTYNFSKEQRETAKSVMDHCESMVRSFARGSAPVTDSIERDLQILGNKEGLAPGLLSKCRVEMDKQTKSEF